jgi:bisphosphoglycerate-independent phosphoglycerate mutase (AlkP superfamily)
LTALKDRKAFYRYHMYLTQYDATMPNVKLRLSLRALSFSCDIVSKAGLKQLRIAEYTKYAQVTFFINGGGEVQFG